MTITLKTAIQFAGVVQLFIIAANFFLPAILDYRGNLAKVAPIIRQIFIIHAIYIVLVLAGFAASCFLFAGDLAGHSAPARFVDGFLALFWLPRVGIQAFYYDQTLKQEHRFGNFVFTTAFLYLAIVFTVAAILK